MGHAVGGRDGHVWTQALIDPPPLSSKLDFLQTIFSFLSEGGSGHLFTLLVFIILNVCRPGP